jgi:hypothetical protein
LIPPTPVASAASGSYPGNCNQLIVKLSTYAATLARTRGLVPEVRKDVSRQDLASRHRTTLRAAGTRTRGGL